MTLASRARYALRILLVGIALSLPLVQATALVSTGTASAATPSLVGDWVNVDPATRNIVRINITQTSVGTFAHVYGACSPSACDWGLARVSSEYPGFATYNQGFAIKYLTISRSGLYLVVSTYVHFTDHSGRADYHTVDRFYRLLLQG